jgi:hypothetical protein
MESQGTKDHLRRRIEGVEEVEKEKRRAEGAWVGK